MREIVGGRFALLPETVGAGGGGEVYKAVDLDSATGAHVAIKFVTGHPDDPTTKLYFQRETSTLSKLSHPNIVRLLDYGWYEDRKQHYLALEWASGTLRALMDPPAWINWDDFAERVAIPLAEALSYAHLENVEHCDIKPENILMSGGVPKLADFGIAKLREQVDPIGMTLVGWQTRPYAPPDNTFGYEKTRDVWALAVVFIQAMTPHYIADYPDIPLRLAEIAVPPSVRALLSRCTDLEPSDRPANGSVLLQELADIQQGRRAEQVRRQATLWLDVSLKAAQKLTGEERPDRALVQRRISEDLVELCYAEYRFDAEAAKLDRSTLYLNGHSWRFILKRMDDAPSFKVVGAVELRDAERVRRRSCAVGHLFEIAYWSPGESQADRAIELLEAALDDHHERRDRERDERQQLASDNELFERFQRLLDAQEEIAQGDRTPFLFTSRKQHRRDVAFKVVGTIDKDLLGEEWDVRVGGSRAIARGEVIAQTEDTITLHFRREPRSIPDGGELSPYLGPTQRSHERQTDAVRRIRDGHSTRPDLRDLLVAPKEIAPPVPVYPATWIRKDLDESKQGAVAAALGARDFVVVEGPPGTGKTSMITELVAQFLERAPESKILIVSQTHVAVDNALERLDAASIPGLVRLGQPADPRIAPTVQHLVLDERMDAWSRSLRSKAERHMNAVADRYGIPLRHLHAAIALQELGSVIGNLEHVREKSSSTDASRGETAVTGVDRRRDRVALQESMDSLLERRDDLLSSVHDQLQGDLELSADPDRQEVRAASGALLGEDKVPELLMNLVKLQGEWLQRVASDRKLVETFLATTNVLAGTCIGFLGHPAVRDLEFDLCILDEASKATATEALVPMSRASRWVLVGDTRQLPPMDEEVLRKPDLMKRYDLDEEFVRTTLFERLVEATEPPVRHLLTEQYRMVRPIGDMISTVFYDGNLRSPNETSIPGLDLLGKPVLWLDTGVLNQQRYEDHQEGGTKSRSNRTEARLVIKRLEDIHKAIERGYIQPPDGRRLSVLVISPYQLQNRELERRLATFQSHHLDVEVQSVDAVQGREADLAIFSVTRSNRYGDLGFLAHAYRRRINVALSRARFGLTVVGDLGFCESQPGGLRDVGQYIRSNTTDCEIRGAHRG